MTTQARDKARRRYIAERPAYEKLAKAVARQIQILSIKDQLGCNVTCRAKDVSSYVKKVIEKDLDDPWNEIYDMAGVRVIVRHSGDLDRAVRLIKENLSPIYTIDDRESETGEDQLRYPRLHFQVRASALPSDFGYGPDDERSCEIQVRTAAADLWAGMSHKFLYKPSGELPRNVRRSLYGLLALVEVYDREVERAVAELARLPDHLLNSIVDQAERIYYTFCATSYNLELSREILSVVLQAVDEGDRPQYGEILAEFADREHHRLAEIYQRYGPVTEVGAEGSFVLVGQPEGIAIFERLSTTPLRLADVWNSYLPEELLLEMRSLW
ncbi:GTP pyrophosphokinase [Micromonospora orduensis]|uniref:GTP pyrophosphokinase n=1 Tax=Micromonospora orduensis TaxID=1420891 RepID=UPI00142E97E0|nr:RelA/SpoT domain-containing protein [Micromonospora orduensis]